MKCLILDMDGTLFNFHQEINYMERMYEKGFFKNLMPYQTLVDGIYLFHQKYPFPIFICSSVVSSAYCIEEKDELIDAYLPFIPKQNRLFPPNNTNKADYIKQKLNLSELNHCWLLDDYNKNLEEFKKAGGQSIKFQNDINHKGYIGKLWNGVRICYQDTPEMICEKLKTIIISHK